MPKIDPQKTDPFEKHTEQYESWFTNHKDLYEAELEAIRKLLPKFQRGIEIGVGTGQFSAPLGIKKGIEPSGAMAQKAKERGIEVLNCFAEKLDLKSGTFDLAMMVTTICFVDNALNSLKEAYRILEPGAFFLLGFVDAKSKLGQLYRNKKDSSLFYKDATFFSTDELITLCRQAGFGSFAFVQTLLGDDPGKPVLEVRDGYGQGGFVVLLARRPH